ncbi:hypothetical protein LLG95_14815, partial [bacterium]|nr:hypothetical protein [bacterium]
RLELDRMIPYLEERLVEFHIVETEEPLTEDDISEEFSEEFSEESVDSIDPIDPESLSNTAPRTRINSS